MCQQVTLASGLNEPSYLAVRGATATWTDFTNGDVLGMSTWGGSPATFLTGQATPSGLACIPVGNTIASNATTTFWTDGSSIKSGPTPCDPAGGCTPTVLASGLSWARALTIDATTVYFTSMDSILSVPLGGGAISTLASGQNGPWSLAIDDLNVYWTANDGTVQSVPLAGGAVTTIATGLNPCGLALDSTTVYWTDIGAGTVSKVAKP